MEPWQNGGAPWCIGSVFPAPQVLTGASAIPLGPLLFDGIGFPQRLLSTGSPLPPFESSVPSVSKQKEEFLSSSADAYFPEDLLEEHLQEDSLLRRGFSDYKSQILGNRLQLVECRDGDHALFFPTGRNTDRIGGALCSRDTASKWHVSVNAASHQSLQPLCNTSISLRQPILQLSAVRKDPWDPDHGCLVAARSLYKVQFLTAKQEESQVGFTLPMTANFTKYVSHVAWNQHVQGEAAVVLETGEVLLFDLQRGWSTSNLSAKASYNAVPESLNSSTSSFASKRRINRPRSKIAMHKKKVKPPPVCSPFEWWQCEYAWHPKTLFLAGSKEVSLMDFRVKHKLVTDQLGNSSIGMEHPGQNLNTSVVARIPGVGRTAGYCNHAGGSDVVLSFTRGDHDGMYEFCISTNKHVLLFDTRQPRTPLLQWLHGMEAEPPSLLALCPIPTSSRQSSAIDSRKGNAILAASFHSGNIHAFCYGPHPTPTLPSQNGLISVLNPSHLEERVYSWDLPSKVVAPQAAPNNWAAILASDMNFFQQESSKIGPIKRTWDHLSGLVVLPQDVQIFHRLETLDELHNGKGFSLMQLTGEGNIFAQHFQAASRLHSVGSHVQSVHGANADATGIKSSSKKCKVIELGYFLNYIRNGSSLFECDDSKPFKHAYEVNGVSMESDYPSEDQRALVPWKSSLDNSLNQLAFQTEDPRVEEENCFLFELHEESNRQRLSAITVEVLQQSNVALSIYEIAHVVLRRYLPADLEKLAAGMPMDGQSHCSRKYLSMLLTSHVPEGSMIEYTSQESNTELSEEELKVPLPVLLERCSLGDRGKKRLNHNDERDAENIQLSIMARKTSLSTGRSILQEGCDHVRLALHNLTTEMRSKELVPDLSLADSVEAWNSIPLGVEGLDKSRFVEYKTSDRESIVPRVHGKPFKGQHLDMIFPMAIDTSGGERSIFEGNSSEDSRRQTSVLDKHALRTFLGTYLDSSSTREILEDSHLCPIQLPFISSSETSENLGLSGLSSLRDQFKLWQESFVPYQNFCRDNLPGQL